MWGSTYSSSSTLELLKVALVGILVDAPPSSLLNPIRVQLCLKAEIVGTWCRSQLPALKGVRGAC